MSFHFDAPWSTMLRVITLVVLALAGWAVFSGFTEAIAVMTVALLGSVVLSVRGYEVEPGRVRVLRLG